MSLKRSMAASKSSWRTWASWVKGNEKTLVVDFYLMPEIAPIDHTDHTWKKGPTGPLWLPKCLVRFDYSGTLMSSRKIISQSVGNTHIFLRRIEGLHH